MRRRDSLFVHVQLYELHQVDAVLAVPVSHVERLAQAGFIHRVGDSWVSTSIEVPIPGRYTDDMLLKTPGAFVVRS